MKTLTLTIIIFTVIMNIIWMRKQSLINKISKHFTNDAFLRNSYEVIVQPKWFNYSNYFPLSLWLVTLVLGLLTYKWKFILILIALYYGSYILSKIIPLPPKSILFKMFRKTIISRYNKLTIFPEYEHKFIQDLNTFLNDGEACKKI